LLESHFSAIAATPMIESKRIELELILAYSVLASATSAEPSSSRHSLPA